MQRTTDGLVWQSSWLQLYQAAAATVSAHQLGEPMGPSIGDLATALQAINALTNAEIIQGPQDASTAGR